MLTSVQLDAAIDERLDKLAAATGRTKAFDLLALIEGGLDDLEDAYLGAAALAQEVQRRSGEAAIPLEELVRDLGLEG